MLGLKRKRRKDFANFFQLAILLTCLLLGRLAIPKEDSHPRTCTITFGLAWRLPPEDARFYFLFLDLFFDFLFLLQIQSVGTPFKGSAGAGSGADLIKIFGYGCGSAFDLTVDGSALWVTGIQAETRKDVHFFHTVYADKGLIKYCNLAANTGLFVSIFLGVGFVLFLVHFCFQSCHGQTTEWPSFPKVLWKAEITWV